MQLKLGPCEVETESEGMRYGEIVGFDAEGDPIVDRPGDVRALHRHLVRNVDRNPRRRLTVEADGLIYTLTETEGGLNISCREGLNTFSAISVHLPRGVLAEIGRFVRGEKELEG